MPVVFLFVDGLGIGERSEVNCLTSLVDSPIAVFSDYRNPIPHGGRLAVTDPRMGVNGRPQSASGQSTILTGINIPAELGYHKQGFPNERMRQIIRRHSLFSQLINRGVKRISFANAYSPPFFEKPQRWLSTTTVAVQAAGIPLNKIEDIRSGNALYHDFTNRSLRERGYDVEQNGPEVAARILANIAANHDFTFFEYFLTDVAGHSRDRNVATRVLSEYSDFLGALLHLVDFSGTTVILTSDHGNIEDISIRNHTLNDVPTLVWGKHSSATAEKIKSLTDICPVILGLFPSTHLD